jgi:hypothetical protein
LMAVFLSKPLKLNDLHVPGQSKTF